MTTETPETAGDATGVAEDRAHAAGRTWVTALMFAVLGFGLFVAHHDLPVLRNGMVYARVALNLVTHGFDIAEVVLDPELSYYRPLGFPILAAIFVPLLGPNAATIFASFVGGLVLLLACVGFFGHFNRRLGIDPRLTWLQLVLVFLNPLALYQFWSAYPDGLFAALFVLFFWLFDRALHERDGPAWLLPASYGVLYLAIMVKQYGLVLLPLHVLYLLTCLRAFRDQVLRVRRQRWVWMASVIVLTGLLGSSFSGLNPTLNLSMRGGGLMHYVAGFVQVFEGVDDEPDEGSTAPVRYSRAHETHRDLIIDNLNQLVVFFVVVFNLALLLALSRHNLNRKCLGLGAITAAYIIGLLLYQYSWFNMRFYLPVAPPVALLIVNGFQHARRRWLAVVPLALTLLFNMLTSFNYNTWTGQRLFARFNDRVIPYSTPPRRFPYFVIDSLRMYWHIQRKVQFDHINETLPPEAKLFFVHVYTSGVSRGIYTTPGRWVGGMFRPDIRLEFFSKPSRVPWSNEECRGADHPCFKYRATKFRRPRPNPRPPSRRTPWYVDRAWGLYQIFPEAYLPPDRRRSRDAPRATGP